MVPVDMSIFFSRKPNNLLMSFREKHVLCPCFYANMSLASLGDLFAESTTVKNTIPSSNAGKLQETGGRQMSGRREADLVRAELR